jgi:CRP-like cAMP-binding protein
MLDRNIELLEHVPLLTGLTHAQLTAIADCASKAFFQTGETIIAEGESGDAAYIILTGKAVCSVPGRERSMPEDLWPGTLIGELAMLVDMVHPVTVVAVERVRALVISREAFHQGMEADPAIAQHVSERLLVRLHGLAEDLRTIDERLAVIADAA